MDPRAANRSVDKLRSLRVRRDRDLSLAAELSAGVLDAKKRRKAVEGIGAVWAELIGEALAAGPGRAGSDPCERAAVRSFARGVLTIAAEDAATRYEIDRWLRAGGLEKLRKRSPKALVRVKVV